MESASRVYQSVEPPYAAHIVQHWVSFVTLQLQHNLGNRKLSGRVKGRHLFAPLGRVKLKGQGRFAPLDFLSAKPPLQRSDLACPRHLRIGHREICHWEGVSVRRLGPERPCCLCLPSHQPQPDDQPLDDGPHEHQTDLGRRASLPTRKNLGKLTLV